jgi:transposase
MMTRGEEFVDQGQQYFEQRYRERVVQQLTRRARELGMELVPANLAA